jgi:hypothetical protein
MLEYSIEIPRANPPLRRRHNTTNGLCSNDLGEVGFYVYKGCDWVDEGFRLTAPKKGADNVEDDSLPQQHCTTAVSYWQDYIMHRYIDKNKSVMRKKV